MSPEDSENGFASENKKPQKGKISSKNLSKSIREKTFCPKKSLVRRRAENRRGGSYRVFRKKTKKLQ